MNKELEEIRSEFRKWVTTHNFYPNAADPVLCYVLDVELGLDPRTMPTDQAITKNTYKVFLTEPGGKKLRYDKDFNVLTVTRKFTPEQRTKLVKWWPVLFGTEYV